MARGPGGLPRIDVDTGFLGAISGWKFQVQLQKAQNAGQRALA
jgi:hypothetical protein